MIAYLVIEILSYFCSIIAFKIRERKFIFLLFSFIGILLPSLMAAYRDDTVGRDLLLYAVPNFDYLAAYVHTLAELKLFYETSGLEFFWIIFNFLITRFSDDIFWSFFIQQLLVLSLFYITCDFFRKQLNAPLLYLVFLLTFFCFSMSANRQIFAIAIVAFSCRYLFSQHTMLNLIKFIIAISIATLFHHSAIIALLFYPLYNFSVKSESVSFNKLISVFIIGVILYLSFNSVVYFLINMGILNEKYSQYINQDYNVHKIDILFWFFMFCLSFKFSAGKYCNISKIFVLSTIFIILCGVYNDVATRITMYLECVAFISILSSISESRNRKVMILLFFFLVLSVFVYKATTSKFGDAIPYTSEKLGVSFD